MERKTDRTKVILSAAVCAAVFLFIVFSVGYMKNREDRNSEQYNENLLEYAYEKYRFKDNLTTVLLIGVDKLYEDVPFSYVNNQQADFLMLMIYDRDSARTTLLSINRDTMCYVPHLDIYGNEHSSTFQQIALSHNYGSGKEDSCRNVKKAVMELMKIIRIDYFLSVTMDAVGVINDAVGGVEIDGQLLLGQEALKYVRARMSLPSGSNLERLERQANYLKKLFETAKANKDNIDRIDLMSKISDYVVTDMSVTQLEKMADSLEASRSLEVVQIPGEAEKGMKYIEFYIDKEKMMRILLDLFYDKAS